MSELISEEDKTTAQAGSARPPEVVTRISANTSSASSVAVPVANPSKPIKDNWDKLAAVAPIISGVLIFLAGGVFTYIYNLQQLKVMEIQTIEKFIPHLTGTEQSKKAAILAINSLTDAKLAGKIAAIYASSGTVSALQSISKTGSDNDRAIAEQALKKTMDNLKEHENRLDNMVEQYRNDMQTADSGAVSDLDTPVSLIGQSVTYKTIGDYALSEQLLKRALILAEKKNGAESEEAAYVWRKLADLNAARGNKAQSEICTKHADAIELKINSAQTKSVAPQTKSTPAQAAPDAVPTPENSSSLPQSDKESEERPRPSEG